MSKGMWTKQFTKEGKAFYYNAAQNRSVWHPPSDSVVHEAPQLKIPSDEPLSTLEVPAQATTDTVSQIESSPSFSPPPPPPPAPISTYSSAVPYPMQETYIPVPIPVPVSVPLQTVPIHPPISDEDINRIKNHELMLEMQAKIDQALLQKQKELTAKKAKKPVGEDEQQSSSDYLRQKSQLEHQAGL